MKLLSSAPSSKDECTCGEASIQERFLQLESAVYVCMCMCVCVCVYVGVWVCMCVCACCVCVCCVCACVCVRHVCMHACALE